MAAMESLSRRSFIKGAGAAALSFLTPFNVLSRLNRAAPVIEKITILRVPGEFYRPIAMNAYDDAPKGKSGTTRIVQVFLDDKTVGIGSEGYISVNGEKAEKLEKLIGVSPLSFYDWRNDRITGISKDYRSMLHNPDFAFLESALLDAAGKLKNRPVWKLFGEKVRNAVDCYDGTLYFKDIELGRDASVIGNLAARIKADGYKAIKMKVGRPDKWMKGEAGVTRDIEAFIAAREAVGRNFNLMADANNGYRSNFDWAIRFLEECAPYDMYWIEEIFPDDIDRYRRLYKVLSDKKIPIRIAEGESINDVERFEPYLRSGLYHFIQPDMSTAGFSNILRAANMAQQYETSLVPHTWRSEMGKMMSIHAAMIRRNIYFVEDDRYNDFGLDTSDYLFRDGRWKAPELPGWGIRLSENYEKFRKNNEELVIS